MGNSASSAGRSQHDETVDYGYLYPQGVYTGPRDWNQGIVTQLILDRRLAPFYRPLEDYEESWDDEQILAARRKLPDNDDVATSDSGSRPESSTVSRASSFGHHNARRSPTVREFGKIPEAMVYRGAVECPICFLYYPPNINHSRCCDQAICTECFVQIKRAEPTTTHLVSEPAACPYCVQENFGVVYTPPPWRAGLGSEGSPSPSQSAASRNPSMETPPSKDKSRRKSFSPDSAEVVTIDQIRPDWEAKLAAVRAAVARRANRRIIMRQVGDRLIPVGVTSGRIQPLNVDGAQGEPDGPEGESRSSRRSRRRQHQQAPQDLSHLLGSMGLGGQDLEELMVMEAMRLSLMEHEEQQRREAEKKKKAAQEGASNAGNDESGAGPSTAAASSSASPTSTTPRDIPSGRSGPPSDISGSPHSGVAASAGHLSARAHTPTAPSPLSNSTILSASAPVSAAVGPNAPPSLRTDVSSVSTPGRRTPSPLPRRSGEQQASPLRYSTLSAALASHSTAAAILGSGNTDTRDVESSATGAGTDGNAEGRSGEQVRVPDGGSGTAKIGEGSASALTQDTAVDEVGANDQSSSRNMDGVQKRKSTTSSSVVGSAARYDELPSSPESTISRQPLLRQDTIETQASGKSESATANTNTNEREGE